MAPPFNSNRQHFAKSRGFWEKSRDPSYDLAFLVFFFLALALDACLYFGPLFAAAPTARLKRVHASACNSMSAGLIRLSSGFFIWRAQSNSIGRDAVRFP
jgi:zinc transporter ZupT